MQAGAKRYKNFQLQLYRSAGIENAKVVDSKSSMLQLYRSAGIGILGSFSTFGSNGYNSIEVRESICEDPSQS